MAISSEVLAWALIGLSFFIALFGAYYRVGLLLVFSGLILVIVGIVIIFPTIPSSPSIVEQSAWNATMLIFVALGIGIAFFGGVMTFQSGRSRL